MTEGYCDKCKTSREILNPVEEQLKSGRRSIRGRCPDCGTNLFKLVPNCEVELVDEPESAFAPLSPTAC